MSKYLPLPKSYTPINGVAFSPPNDDKIKDFDYLRWLRTIPNETLKTLSDPSDYRSAKIEEEKRRRML